MAVWPNFFIVGLDKAGTTSLYEYLKKNPSVYMSPIKEPWYFAPIVGSRKNSPPRTEDEKNYLKLFEKVKDEIAIGEASAVYWRDPKTAYLIHDKIPSAKIIISLRDPVERFFSGYLMNYRKNLVKTSFRKYVEKWHDSLENHLDNNEAKSHLYFENIQRYFKIFDKKQIKIIIFEEWIENVKETVEDILKFLQVPDLVYEFEVKAFNTSDEEIAYDTVLQNLLKNKYTRKLKHLMPNSSKNFITRKFFTKKIKSKQTMEKEEREKLIRYYKDDVNKLENLLGRKFPWSNFHY